MPSFDELRSFAETHAPTRLWIESVKDEVIEEIKPSQGHVVLLRNILEDLLVCGAACLEGDELVDVGTITLLLDSEGKTPRPPAPAYMQSIKGRTAALLTAERLAYIKLRGEGIYPCSPIEKVMQIKTEISRVFFDAVLLKGERLPGAAFVPRVGERVEFRSDRQTEKGPSAGSVVVVDRDAKTATIRHSDHPGETFRWADVKVDYFVIAHDGSSLWVLE